MDMIIAEKATNALYLSEGFFTFLQEHYLLQEEKRKQHQKFHPDLSKLKPALFWDTNIKQN